MSFLARHWPYILIGICVAILYGLYSSEKARYGALQTEYANYRASVAEANALANKAAREALDAQIRERTQIDKRNAEVLRDHETATNAIAADRDRARELVRRLLAARESRPADSGRVVSQAGDIARTSEAGRAGSDVEAGELLVDASAECRRNAARLNALIAELAPQL